jgi:hypothetical protein
MSWLNPSARPEPLDLGVPEPQLELLHRISQFRVNIKVGFLMICMSVFTVRRQGMGTRSSSESRATSRNSDGRISSSFLSGNAML